MAHHEHLDQARSGAPDDGTETRNVSTSRETSSMQLARKLTLLIDAAKVEGQTVTFNDIEKAMKAAGTPVSRSKWQYMIAGSGRRVQDETLLVNLAKFFGVNPDYLLDSKSDLPERVEAQMELLSAMRVREVTNFAARQLAEIVSPDTLRQITEALEEAQAEARARGK